MKLCLELGALSDDISAQIRTAGLAVPVGCERFDQDAHAISRLWVRGLLTEDETDKARRRLMRAVGDAMGLICQKHV